MADIFRRAHARIRCDTPFLLMTGVTGGRVIAKGNLLDMSLSGAYMRCDSDLTKGTTYRIVFDTENGALELPCRVARIGARGGPKTPTARFYGLIFTLSADQERFLRRWLDILRKFPPPGVESELDKSLRNYWNNPKSS